VAALSALAVVSLNPSAASVSAAPAAGRHDGVEPQVDFYPQTVSDGGAGSSSWNLNDLNVPLRRDGTTLDGAGVRIAVIDTGIDADDPRVEGHVAAAASFVDSSNTNRGHGTEVASVIAAVAPSALILDAQVCDAARCTNDALVRAITWAVQNGAQVINISLAGTRPSATVHTAIAGAVSHGVVVVAAAGNDGANGNPTEYPAAYSEVISVGAVGPDHAVASFSSSGPWLDVMAPGSDIPGLDDGTSFAAPHVAGIAALVKQNHPAYSPATVQAAIESAGTARGNGGDPLNSVPLASATAALVAGSSPVTIADDPAGVAVSWPATSPPVVITVAGVQIRPATRDLLVAKGLARFVIRGPVTAGRQIGIQVAATALVGSWSSTPQLFTLRIPTLGQPQMSAAKGAVQVRRAGITVEYRLYRRGTAAPIQTVDVSPSQAFGARLTVTLPAGSPRAAYWVTAIDVSGAETRASNVQTVAA